MRLERELVASVAVLLVAGGATGAALGAAGHGGAHSSHVVAHPRNLYQAAASYLGTDTRTLEREVHPGHTLADIASTTSGKSVRGLEAALLSYVHAQFRKGAAPTSAAKRSVMLRVMRQRVEGFATGTCPLKLGALFKSLSGGCHGMSMH
jgi:hypothetical protein